MKTRTWREMKMKTNDLEQELLGADSKSAELGTKNGLLSTVIDC